VILAIIASVANYKPSAPRNFREVAYYHLTLHKKKWHLSPYKCFGFACETVLFSLPHQNFKPPCGCHLWSQIVKVQSRGGLAPNGMATGSLAEIRQMVETLLGNHIYTEGHRHDHWLTISLCDFCLRASPSVLWKQVMKTGRKRAYMNITC